MDFGRFWTMPSNSTPLLASLGITMGEAIFPGLEARHFAEAFFT